MPLNPNSPTKRWMLHKILHSKFDEEEFRTLCYFIGVNYDDLEGDKLSGKTRALLLYLERREEMHKLEEFIKRIRPDISLDVPENKSNTIISERYTIIDVLGKGGMATVYLAEDSSLTRLVAVKVIDSGEESIPERFQQEIEIISNLMHPAIVPIHDTGIYQGKTYYVMSHLLGGSLRQILNSQGSLPLRKVIAIVKIISGALEKVHQMGIVHRDIKPDNILLDEDGNVFLSDFGIAIIADAPRQTTTGNLTGSLPYMAPEQITKDSPIGPYTDIYQLGVTVFELLTGKLPFDQMFGPLLKATSINPALPEECNEVLLKAMAKAKAQRFATVAEFAEALENLLTKQPEITESLPIPNPCSESPLSVLSEIKKLYPDQFVSAAITKPGDMVHISFAPIERRIISIKIDSQKRLKLRFHTNSELSLDLSREDTQIIDYCSRCWYMETQSCKEPEWLNEFCLGDIDISSCSNVVGIKIVHFGHKATLYILLFIA